MEKGIMMEKELHKKVDEKVGEELEKMRNGDPFLYSSMESIYTTIKTAEIPTKNNWTQGTLPYVPIELSLSIAADFLGQCNPQYKELLWQKYRDGKIIFTNKKDNRTFYNFHLDRSQIFINPEETLTDAMSIIHEVFHDTNCSRLLFRRAFTETVSIASELMFLEQLEDQGYSKLNINLLAQTRGLDYIRGLHHLKWMLPLFISKKSNGTIDEQVYDQLPILAQMTRESIESSLNVFLKTDRTELERYKYVLGYILAKSFVLQNRSFEELSELSEALKEGDATKFYDMTFGNYRSDTIPSVVKKDEFSYHPRQLVKK